MDATLDDAGRSLGSRAPTFDQHSFFTFESPEPHCYRRLGEGEFINKRTGELSAHQCKALSCPYCVTVQRQRLVRAVGASSPTAFLTFTLAGDDIAATAARMTRLRRKLAPKGFPMEWVWIVECNRRSETNHHAHHVHALAHGNIPPQWILAEWAQWAGFGMDTKIEEIDDPYRTAGYLWNKAVKWRRLDVPHRLWTNGEQLQHSTHAFWRVDGERVAGWREAYLASRGQA